MLLTVCPISYLCSNPKIDKAHWFADVMFPKELSLSEIAIKPI